MYPDVPAPAAASVEADAAEPVALPLWRKRAAVAGAQGQAAVAAGAQVEFEASNRLRVTTAVLAEMLNYRTVPCTQINPLQWWKKHCHECSISGAIGTPGVGCASHICAFREDVFTSWAHCQSQTG